MAKPEWGTKRTCPSCAVGFYDLNKNPAVCPKCGHKFDPALLNKSRRGRGARKAEAEDVVVKLEPKKKVTPKKKIKGDDDDVDLDGFDDAEAGSADEIEEIDDDVGDLEELEDIDSGIGSDDADDESIIEDLDAGAETLVDSIEEEEYEEEEEEEDSSKKSTSKAKAKPKAKPKKPVKKK